MLEEVTEKTKNNAEYIYKKLPGGYGIGIIREYVDYLKKNNPNAEIKLNYHEPYNDLFSDIMLITNQPLEELNKDNKARTRNVIRDFELSSKKEYEDKMIEEPLRFNDLYTENQFFEIVNQLRGLHPNCKIYAYYNTDKKVGKILPDGVAFENLKFDQVHIRNQNGNSYGIDADGYIGIRPDAIATYTPNGEDMYRPSITKEKNYKTYYGKSLYANIKGNDVNDIELESMKEFFENMEKEDANKNKMNKADKDAARERVRFETMAFEEDMKKRRDKFNEFISMMKKLNPNVEFEVGSNEYHTVIYTSVSMDQLKFPEGFKEIGTNNVSNPNSYYDSTYYFEEMKKTKSDASLNNGETNNNLSQSSADKLLQMAREQRKFTILQRERAMSEAQKGKNRSALMAGICMLGAATALYFKNMDTTTVIQHELEALRSWKGMGQYLQDLGPLTTVLVAGAAGFIGKYFKYSKKFKKAQNEFIDMNNAMMIQNSQESLGGEDNAKSR